MEELAVNLSQKKQPSDNQDFKQPSPKRLFMKGPTEDVRAGDREREHVFSQVRSYK